MLASTKINHSHDKLPQPINFYFIEISDQEPLKEALLSLTVLYLILLQNIIQRGRK